MLLDKFGARKWFTRILLTWGLITMAMALIQGPKVLSLKVLLGVAEAGFSGCFISHHSVVSGAASRKNHGNVCAFTTDCHDDCRPLAGLLLGMDGIANLHGWQWLFVAVGLPAVLLALPTFCGCPITLIK